MKLRRNHTERKPHWIVSLIPVCFLIIVLSVVIRIFGTDALDGASQVALLLAAGLTIGIGMLVYGTPWSKFSDAIDHNVGSIGSSILILLMIGAISGTWMVSGVIPSLIYYGLSCVSPSVFLFACCLLSALVSLITGSSWTTIATIGVALIGIGDVLGFSTGWTAGAIISGAYFGDKMSPLSDTTVMASSTTGTDIFVHIKYMVITTVPSILIALTVFLVVSLCHKSVDIVDVESIQTGLASAYNISGWLMIVPVVTLAMIALRVPAALTLMISAIIAAVAAIFAQPGLIAEIGGGDVLNFTTGFKGIFTTVYGHTETATGNEMLDALLETNGMVGMMSTIFLIVSAIVFGATLMGSGMITSITEALTRHIRRRVPLVASTALTGIFSNIAIGDQYISIIMTSSLYKEQFEKNGYESRLLSRTIEDSTTVTSVLVPWNTCGMTQSTVLKVPTIDYLPYCIFNLISPLMSVLIAALGYKIVKKSVPESEKI